MNGNLLTLTDPVENTTTWTYDNLGRVIEETNELDDAREFEYDAAGSSLAPTATAASASSSTTRWGA